MISLLAQIPPEVKYLFWFILFIIVAVVLFVSVIKKCYLVVGPDKAIVKTGWGAMDVTTAGGMLVFPVVNKVE